MYSLVQPVTFLKPTSFQIDDRSEAGGDLVSEEDLLLREMLARYILHGLQPCVLLVTYCCVLGMRNLMRVEPRMY